MFSQILVVFIIIFIFIQYFSCFCCFRYFLNFASFYSFTNFLDFNIFFPLNVEGHLKLATPFVANSRQFSLSLSLSSILSPSHLLSPIIYFFTFRKYFTSSLSLVTTFKTLLLSTVVRVTSNVQQFHNFLCVKVMNEFGLPNFIINESCPSPF